MGPPRKIGKICAFFRFFRPTQKIGPEGPKWGQEDFFPTNPDLADILGRMDFDFENSYFLDLLGSQLGPNLGPAWARLGPGLGPAWARAWARAWAQAWGRAWARLGPGLGPAWDILKERPCCHVGHFLWNSWTFAGFVLQGVDFRGILRLE